MRGACGRCGGTGPTSDPQSWASAARNPSWQPLVPPDHPHTPLARLLNQSPALHFDGSLDVLPLRDHLWEGHQSPRRPGAVQLIWLAYSPLAWVFRRPLGHRQGGKMDTIIKPQELKGDLISLYRLLFLLFLG